MEELYLVGFEAAVEYAKKVGQSFFVWNHKMFPSIQDKIDSEGFSVYKWGEAMGMPDDYPYIIGNVK